MEIGLDLGSSSVKAVRISSSGKVLAVAYRPVATRREDRGRVEQDAWKILTAARAVLGSIGARDGARLGIATQRSTVLFWDRDSGRPLTPAYSWQDRRAAALCDRLSRRGGASRRPDDPPTRALPLERTGLRLSPHYSASKLAWALRHEPGLRRRVASGRALWGTLGAFLLWHLSAGAIHAIDHANAQRTLLFDLLTLDWDGDLVRAFGLQPLFEADLRPALLPTVIPGALPLDGSGNGKRGERAMQLAALNGDQQAAMHGLGLRGRGDVAINYGSGAFVLVHAGGDRAATPGLLTTLLASWPPGGGGSIPQADRPPEFAIEGTVNSAATAVEWVRRRLELRVPYGDLDRYLDRDPSPRREVHFLPAVAGVGAPRWDASARPRFRGNLRGATTRDLLRAAVESIAYRCAENLRAARGRVAAGDSPIVVAGGLTSCRTLLQAQADLLQRPLILKETPEATGVGAALMARARWREAPPAHRVGERLVVPAISPDEAEARYTAWERAVYAPKVYRRR